jgi:hypothetical protein
MTMNREVRAKLERPFDQRYIKERPGSFGKSLSYVESANIIARLNEAFESDWSFEVVEYQQLSNEVVVLGKLSAAGVVKMQIGNSRIAMDRNGEPLSIGDSIKAAASDCIRKCASLLGIALDLWGELEVPVESTADTATAGTAMADTAREEPKEETPKAKPPRTDMASMSGNLGANRISKDQLSQIKKLRKDLGWSADQVLEKVERMFATKDVLSLNSIMGQALISYLENEGNGRK